MDSESIRSGNVLVQSTHPGPQPRPHGIREVLVSELTVVTRLTLENGNGAGGCKDVFD